MFQPESQQFSEGDLIGERCRVVRLIGRGGMGEVYEAENTWTSRRVAVKVLQAFAAIDTKMLSRFQQEAQAATKLAHRNIIDVLDMGRDERTGVVFIVQELLVGETLRDRVERQGHLDLREAIDLLLPVMGALATAHRSGIVHRDVKPENVFLLNTSEGETVPKLIDFGLAKARDSDAHLTSTGQIMGTPHFMSPEQFRGDADPDGRCDLWATAVMLYEALSGALPFDGATPPAVMFKIFHETPPRLDVVNPQVPTSVADVVHSALQVERDARPAGMEVFIASLLSCEALRGEADAIRERHRRSLRFMAAELASLLPPRPAAVAHTSGTDQGWVSDRDVLEMGATIPSMPSPKRTLAKAQRRFRSVALTAAFVGVAACMGLFFVMRRPATPLRASPAVLGSIAPTLVAPSTPTVLAAQRSAGVDAGSALPAVPPRRTADRAPADGALMRPILPSATTPGERRRRRRNHGVDDDLAPIRR